LIALMSMISGVRAGEFKFHHHYIDRDLPGDSYGQTALVDLDGDGDLDLITGGKDKSKSVYWFEFQTPERWVRHLLGTHHPSDVGGTAIDVNGDGAIDHVAGGVWYRNPGKPRETEFERIVFDPELTAVHDLVAADVDGDGRHDIVTMSDKNNLRWYRIPADPRERWERHDIATGVHAIPFGNPRPPYPFATRCVIADINADGHNDLVLTENEIRAGKIAWLENRSGGKGTDWIVHPLTAADDAERGAYHSLAVADFDKDGDLDIFTVEMEAIPGARPPRWFIWENVDGRGARFVERVIFDGNLGGHEAIVADVDHDGDLDICSKLWRPRSDNANGGRNHADFLENRMSRPPELRGKN
jgi:hypothetical protein